jgi:hypothetical protein
VGDHISVEMVNLSQVPDICALAASRTVPIFDPAAVTLRSFSPVEVE